MQVIVVAIHAPADPATVQPPQMLGHVAPQLALAAKRERSCVRSM